MRRSMRTSANLVNTSKMRALALEALARIRVLSRKRWDESRGQKLRRAVRRARNYAWATPVVVPLEVWLTG